MGPDDIAAIALLAFHEIPISLVTTVHGVCGDELAARLARRVMSALSLHGTQVVPGAPKPLSGDELALVPWMIQRRSDLADFNSRCKLPADTCDQHNPSIDAAAEAILTAAGVSEKPATILALGPLSNVAKAVEKDPANFRKNVGLVVFAGESSTPGRDVCFNARLDLEALEIVLRAKVPVMCVGSRSRMQSEEFYARLGSYDMCSSAAADLISEMSTMRPQSIIDDPTAASYMLCPDMFDCERIEVVCDAVSGLFCRARDIEASPQNGILSEVVEAKSSDAKRFVKLLRSALVTQSTSGF
jgi:inosine-uridine nucleoside N-ribohydrolase